MRAASPRERAVVDLRLLRPLALRGEIEGLTAMRRDLILEFDAVLPIGFGMKGSHYLAGFGR